MTHKPIKEISLVLGSGGARGLAHIGAIRVLEAHGLQIRSLSGSSMGGLIAGFYAAGKLDEYEAWVRELTEFNVLRFLDIAWGGAGMLKGDMLMDTLKDFIGDCRIEELLIPLTIVATDVRARKEVWINKGSLFDAIRASIAIPTVFTPHTVQGQLLLDGGILNPVPIAPTLQDSTDATIAVSVSGERMKLRASNEQERAPHEPEGQRSVYRKRIDQFIDNLQDRLGLNGKDEDPGQLSLIDAAMMSIDTMQASIARCKLAAYPPDLLIEVPINTCGAHEFYRAAEIIAAGEYWAEQALSRFNGEDRRP